MCLIKENLIKNIYMKPAHQVFAKMSTFNNFDAVVLYSDAVVSYSDAKVIHTSCDELIAKLIKITFFFQITLC